jgi:hypothetical protein
MATRLGRRGAAVIALATVSGLSLAALAPAGGAATTSAPAYYQGVTSANVLGVAIHLPAALPSLPNVPKDLAVNLIGVSGNAVHNTLGSGAPTSSTAESTLANGSLVDSLPASLGLNKSVKATLSGQNSVQDPGSTTPAALDPILHLVVGALKADAHPMSNSASGVLSNGDIGTLGGLLGTSSAASNALQTLQSTLQNLQVPGTNQTISQTLNSALGQVENALGSAPAGSTLAATLSQVQAALNAVIAQVQSIIANVGNTAVLTVSALTASQSIAPAAGAAQAVASSNLLDLNVLNGLLTVKGFTSQAVATANGIAGGAHASFSTHQPIVALGTPVLTATLDETGLALQGIPGLGDTINTALTAVQQAINSLLNTLGVHLNFVQGTEKTTSDGTYAAATGPEYDIVVTNPIDNSALTEVGLGHGTVASVSAKQAQHLSLPATSGPHSLAFTGLNLPLVGGAGLALLVLAGYLRRRVLG